MVLQPSTDEPCIVGGYGSKWCSPADPHRFVFSQDTQPFQNMGYTTYFSCAPLTRIGVAYVFEDYETGLCRGILFEYHDGCSRAVGQCRMGVDKRKEYHSPWSISFRSVGRGFLVSLDTPHTDEEGWETRRLNAAIIYFWFTENSSTLVIDRPELESMR